ncbi:MAG: glycosyltransferase family 4 protein [Gemmatimonadales bacterium]|nr:glycosyltransferase family 4 protein [Gemmatimonadales bacterium]
MRIAYVCADRGVPVFGTKGCSVHAQELIRAFRRRGHEVALFAARLGGRPPADLASMAVTELPEFAAGRPADLDSANQATVDRIGDEGGFDLVYERYSLWSHAGPSAAQRLATRALLEVNAPLIDEERRYRGGADLEPARLIVRQALRESRAVVAVSRAVADWVRTLAPSAIPVEVIPNGVDPRRFRGIDRSGDRPGFTIGFVGTMKPWHGLTVLAEAFERLAPHHPEARLLLVGDGPEREPVSRAFERAGLADRVEWTGAVDPEMVPGLLARMDVGVAPYPSGEDCYFSPLKVFEYLAAGLPVVASRVGQLGDVLVHQRSALLVAPGSAVELADGLDLLARDRSLRHRIAGAGRVLVESEFTWDRVAARTIALATPWSLRRRAFLSAAY